MARDIPTEAEVLGWYTSLSNWGRWGADDELGTLNLITPEKRAQAAALVREGLTVSCARTLRFEAIPDVPVPPQHFMLRSGEGEASEHVGRIERPRRLPDRAARPHDHPPGRAVPHLRPEPIRPRPGRCTTASRATWSRPKARWPARSSWSARGSSAEASCWISRGLRGVSWLEATDPVFPEDLEAAEAAQGVRVEPGDILFVRTGYPKRLAEGGPRRPGEGMTGFQAACLPWLRERDVALIGSDTANDVAPTQYPGLGTNGAVHGVGMGAIGLWLLDNPDFEALADACERSGAGRSSRPSRRSSWSAAPDRR